MMRMLRLGAAVALLTTLAAAPASAPYAGTFALQSGRAFTQAHLRASGTGSDPLERHFDLWLTHDASQTVRRYGVDMTKYLHLIAISDDFTTFMHEHPSLSQDGHFSVDVRFAKPGLYHIYADCDPDGRGQQVFRYDVPVASANAHGSRDLALTAARVKAGPYDVALGTTALRAGTDNAVTVRITKNGAPAHDLHPYLGALAHAVFVDAADLSYAHVHPSPLGAGDAMEMSRDASMTDMGSMPPLTAQARSAPNMLLHVAVREAGTYKLWLQFRGNDRLYVAPFVVTAS